MRLIALAAQLQRRTKDLARYREVHAKLVASMKDVRIATFADDLFIVSFLFFRSWPSGTAT